MEEKWQSVTIFDKNQIHGETMSRRTAIHFMCSVLCSVIFHFIPVASEHFHERAHQEASRRSFFPEKRGPVSSPFHVESWFQAAAFELRSRAEEPPFVSRNLPDGKFQASGVWNSVRWGNCCWLNIGGGRRTSALQVRDGTVLRRGKG